MSVFSGFIIAMGATPDGSSPWLQLVPFVLVLGIFYFIILLPMKRKQAKVQEFLDTLKVGDRIITTGGIHGQVTRLSGDVIQIQIAASPPVSKNAPPPKNDIAWKSGFGRNDPATISAMPSGMDANSRYLLQRTGEPAA